MSYSLYDINGYIGQVGTTFGLESLKRLAEKKKKPNIVSFIDSGATLITKVLVSELDSLKSRNKDLISLINNMSELIAKCEICAIISAE